MPAPGWYADPWKQSPLRWWDGRQWTPHGAADAGAPPPDGAASGSLSALSALSARERTAAPTLPRRFAWPAVGALAASIAAEAVVVLALRYALDVPVIVAITVVGVVLYGILIEAARRVALALDDLSWREAFGFSVSVRDLGRGFLVFWVGAIASGVAVSVLGDNDNLRGDNTRVLTDYRHDVQAFLILGAFTVVVAPIVEELFFRGLLLRAFNAALGEGKAVVAQAVLFAAVHFQPLAGSHNVEVLLVIGVTGLVFGWAANHYKTLGPTMVAHAMRNAIALAYALSR
jgi:membrane protease YdiL (CAAX protease family)